MSSNYAHLSSISVVPDQFVKPGEIIGKQGDTGWATGVHLHFQVNLFGIPVNPEFFNFFILSKLPVIQTYDKLHKL